VGTVANLIANQSSFDPRNYRCATLSRLLEALRYRGVDIKDLVGRVPFGQV
jgi:hypothetical protein